MKCSNICCGVIPNGDKKLYKYKKHILAEECLSSKEVYSFLVKGTIAIC